MGANLLLCIGLFGSIWLYSRWLTKATRYSAATGAGQANRAKAQGDREAAALAEWLETDDLDAVLRLKQALNGRGEASDYLLVTRLRSDIAAYRRGRCLLWGLPASAIMLFQLALVSGAFQYGLATCASYLVMPVWLTMPFLLEWLDNHRCCKRRIQNTVTLLCQRPSVQSVGLLLPVNCAGTPILPSPDAL